MNRAAKIIAFAVPVIAIGAAYAWDEFFGTAFAIIGHPPNYGFSRPALIGIPVCVLEAIVVVPRLWSRAQIPLAVSLFGYLVICGFVALGLGTVVI